jgi:hypothetical protein
LIVSTGRLRRTRGKPRVLSVGSASAADGDVAEKRPLGDTTTLADPAVVEEIKERAVSEPAEE